MTLLHSILARDAYYSDPKFTPHPPVTRDGIYERALIEGAQNMLRVTSGFGDLLPPPPPPSIVRTSTPG